MDTLLKSAFSNSKIFLFEFISKLNYTYIESSYFISQKHIYYFILSSVLYLEVLPLSINI